MAKSLAAFIVLYAYVQFFLCPMHTVIGIITGKVNPFIVTKNICDLMGIKFKHTKNSKAIKPNAMFLCNHVCWADFYVDQALTDGAYLSRYLVILGCPMSSLYAWLANSTFFFNRKKGLDRDVLAANINSQWNERPNKGLVLYPEGTRNLKREPLKLKTGVLKMAYDYNRPVQSVISTNKEIVSNERTYEVNRNVEVITSVSEVLEPKEYKTFDDFVVAVRKQFSDTWHDAYNAKSEDTVSFTPPFGMKPPAFEQVPISKRLWILRFVLLVLVAYWMRMKK